MSVHTFMIRHINGEIFTRSEWGRNRRDAIKTLESIYGKGNFEVLP